MADRLFQDVCIAIRRRIANGALRPGDKLPSERELADEFEVGRPVIREALRALEEAGILEFKRGTTGGAFIKSGHPSTMIRSVTDLVFLGAISIENLTEARTVLLSHTAELAAERGTEDDFIRLQANIDEIAALDVHADEPRTVAIVAQFYDLLGYAAKNEMLVFLIHSLSEVVGQIILKTRPEAMSLVLASRRRLLEQLRKRNGKGAANEVIQHLSELHYMVVAQAAELHNLGLDPAPPGRTDELTAKLADLHRSARPPR